MSGLPKSGHLWAIYEYSPSSQMIALRGLSLRTPAPSLLSLGRRAEVALSFSAPTLVVTVLHDNALIVLAARLVIDALALSIDVAFDRTTGRETLRVIPVRGIRRFFSRTVSERSNAGFLERTTVACRQPSYAPGQVLLSNKLHLTAADPQCQLLVTAHKHTHSLEGPSRPLVHAGGLFLLCRAYVNIGFRDRHKKILSAFQAPSLCAPRRLLHGAARPRRVGLSAPGGIRLANSVSAARKNARDAGPRDQRTGSIKCSYCVPGHMT